MISVVIPVHNQARTLTRALKSVLEQGVAQTEIVVVDDGSLDDLDLVMSEFSAEQLTIIRQTQRGPAAARNAGIRASRGEFIAFLDGDDFWLPGKLNAQLAAMKETGRRFSFCGSQVVDEDGSVLAIRPAVDDDGEFSRLVWGNRFPTPSVIVERSLLDQCGLFDESLRTGEDWDLWLRLSASGAGACVSSPLVAVTGERQWAADANQLQNLEYSINAVLGHMSALMAANTHLTPLLNQRRRIAAWHYAVLSKSFRQAGKFGAAIKYAARAIAASPSGLFYLLPGSSNPSSAMNSPLASKSDAEARTSKPATNFEVSVVIRTYNRAAMLVDALESALNQTLPATEIVVIDDGSTDDTPTMVRSYQEVHHQIRYVRTKGNLGADRAAKLGVDECRSRYVAFLDSDDLWLPNHLESICCEFEKNPQSVMIFSRYGVVNDRREPLVDLVREPTLVDPPARQLLLKRIIVQPTRTVFLRQAIADVGGVPLFPAAEDWVLAVLLAARFPDGIKQTDSRTALFRLHASQSYSRPLEVRKTLLAASEYLCDHLPDELGALKARVISTNLLHSAIFLWQAGQTREAWRSLVRAVRNRGATVTTKEFAATLMRLVVPASMGKLVRKSKRSVQRSRSLNLSQEFDRPAVRTRP